MPKLLMLYNLNIDKVVVYQSLLGKGRWDHLIGTSFKEKSPV